MVFHMAGESTCLEILESFQGRRGYCHAQVLQQAVIGVAHANDALAKML